MTKKLAGKPWAQVLRLRDELRSGELTLAQFAADLDEVAHKRNRRPIYEDPRTFFTLTYPTGNICQLVREIAERLAGKSDRTIRKLSQVYGGGKTHSLITLFHLFSNPDALPKVPAVEQFVQSAGMRLPRARVVVISFDKFDTDKGMEALGPNGEKRWLKFPWSAIAFQIAGDDGLRMLHADDKAEERPTPPAENLLAPLLRLPADDDMATLILMDEILMYSKAKVLQDEAWREHLKNFFQYLTQAAVKTERCAMVLSLLASNEPPDSLSRRLERDMGDILSRQKEDDLLPVTEQDVAEVLRRRFFELDSLPARDEIRTIVTAVLRGIEAVDPAIKSNRKAEEDAFCDSYPFHPDLTHVFYSKWTNVAGFQRTRGVLRTYALALRDAEKWDTAPMIGPNVFIGDPATTADVSAAARELLDIATTEELDGRRQDWATILLSELRKARDVQHQIPGLRHREIEQAVFATFLHSQPISNENKASTRELQRLVSTTHPDKLALEDGLRGWADESWFLDEQAMGQLTIGADGRKSLPNSWRLGVRPNLKQIHNTECERIMESAVDARLIEEIDRMKFLTAGTREYGVERHVLPSLGDIGDEGKFHFAILGLDAASMTGKPSAIAKAHLDGRTYPNAVVLVAPSEDGLDVARNKVKARIGWEAVDKMLPADQLDGVRKQNLQGFLRDSADDVRDAIRQMVSIVIAFDHTGAIQAFKITIPTNAASLFELIKQDKRSRIQDSAISADALLPGAIYTLWGHDQHTQRVDTLVRAFARQPRLPKMLRSQEILDTVLNGVMAGTFVVQQTEKGQPTRTFWFERPDADAMADPTLEIALPEHARLTRISLRLLAPDVLPELWNASEISIGRIRAYFNGNYTAEIQKQNFTEPLPIPRATDDVIDAAIRAAIDAGEIWLFGASFSFWKEAVPESLALDNDLMVRRPPTPMSPHDILPGRLPGAWQGSESTAADLHQAASVAAGFQLPWPLVRMAIDEALTAHLIHRPAASGPWPCDFAAASAARFCSQWAVKLPITNKPHQPTPTPIPTGARTAEFAVDLAGLQDFADLLPALMQAAIPLDLQVTIRLTLTGDAQNAADITAALNDQLKELGPTARF